MNELINRETFEAWLFAQPGEREFMYSQGQPEQQPGCLLCNYLRENVRGTFGVRSRSISTRDPAPPAEIYFAEWMFSLLWACMVPRDKGREMPFTAAHAQAQYIKLYGDPRAIEPEVKPAVPQPA